MTPGLDRIGDEHDHVERRHVDRSDRVPCDRLAHGSVDALENMRQLIRGNRTVQQPHGGGGGTGDANAVLSRSHEQLVIVQNLVPIVQKPRKGSRKAIHVVCACYLVSRLGNAQGVLVAAGFLDHAHLELGANGLELGDLFI